jgi:hypothetical protein
MSPLVRSTLATSIVLLLYFVAGSLVADSMRFPYGYVSIGAALLFFLAGYLLVRHEGAGKAVLAVGMSAFIASMLAWIVIDQVVGRTGPRARVDAMGEVVLTMTAGAIVLGGIGAFVRGRGNPA